MQALVLLMSMASFTATAFMVYKDHRATGCLPGSESRFGPSEDKVRGDMVNKSVVTPQGQTWAITSDQKVDFKLINHRVCRPGNMAVYGTLSTAADVGQIAGLKGILKDGEKDGATKAVLEGLVRVDYENVNGQWFFAGVTPLDTKVTVR